MKDTQRVKNLIKQITRHQEVISRERDALRQLQSDIDDLCDPVERANEALDGAVSALSETL